MSSQLLEKDLLWWVLHVVASSVLKLFSSLGYLWGPELSSSLGGRAPQVALYSPFVGNCKFCHSACMASQATKLRGEAESSKILTLPYSFSVKPLLHATRWAFIQILSTWLTINRGMTGYEILPTIFTERNLERPNRQLVYNSICCVSGLRNDCRWI